MDVNSSASFIITIRVNDRSDIYMGGKIYVGGKNIYRKINVKKKKKKKKSIVSSIVKTVNNMLKCTSKNFLKGEIFKCDFWLNINGM